MPEQHFQMWSDVRPGSRLVISVSGTTDDKFIVAMVDGLVAPMEGGAASPIFAILETVTGTPFIFPLEGSRVYGIDINVTFMTAATATIHAHIEADGNRMLGELNSTVTRDREQVDSSVLSIGTRA